MNRFFLASLFLLVGCTVDREDPEPTSTVESELCNDCGPILPKCSSVCSTTADCDSPCRLIDGSESSCFGYGTCQTCSSTCSATADCNESCKLNGAMTTCGAQNSCQKYDVYCAYPAITYAEVSSTHESYSDFAYMYFASASHPKSGSVPRMMGNRETSTTDTWASNFRGPFPVTGENRRTQWEWDNDAAYGMQARFGFKAAPYAYGRECLSVPRGKALAPPVPRLTIKSETVYEDDECLDEATGIGGTGICNPDDLVGHFWMDRSACNDQVFAQGQASGWTTGKSATTDGSLSKVSYELYCYSCKNAWSPSCSAGILF